MIDTIDKLKCTGCKMCADVCAVNAITFDTDIQGFWYPKVNSSCVKCGACVKKCIVERPLKITPNRIGYAAYSKDDKIRRDSTSGGIYYELAHKILYEGGYLAGSVYSEDFYSAYHIISNNPKDLSRLMGSKYFQSDTEGIYSKVKQILDDNKEVLFTGTPCQVWALKEYLGRKYENLYTVDLLCRGVPSPKMHMKKIQSYEEKAKSRVREFRDKSKYEGWANFGEYMTFKNGKKRFISRWDDHINDCFIHKNLNIRESCYRCTFKDGNSAADLSIGDFWGISGQTEKDDIYGVSCVIANTNKGNTLMDSLKDKIYLDKVNIEDIQKGNPAYVIPAVRPEDRDTFYDIVNVDGINAAVKYFTDLGLKYQLKRIKTKFVRKIKKHKFFIKNIFDIRIIQFIKLNYFSKNIIRDKETYIYPMKGALLQINKNGIIELHANLYLNYYSSYRKGNSQTILRVDENGKLVVRDKVVLAYGNTLSIASRAIFETGYLRTGVNTNIICAQEMRFGQRVMLGRNVCIFDSDYHPIYNDKFERINDNKAVIIGDNCWVGANSMVLKGAVLDNGCIVSANSMVMGNVDENKVYINKREAKSVGENVVWKM